MPPELTAVLYAQRRLEAAQSDFDAVLSAYNRQEVSWNLVEEAAATVEIERYNFEASGSQLHLAEAARIARGM